MQHLERTSDSSPTRRPPPAIIALALAASLAACHAETDAGSYLAGQEGLASLSNDSPIPVFLPGCSAFSYEQRVDGEWQDRGPSIVCFWEGIARELPPGASSEDAFVAPSISGLWRLRYEVAGLCTPGLPLSQASCARVRSVPTPPFRVERELCDPADRGCRFVPGAPNFLCSDGVSVGGPSGECTLDPDTAQCGYEFLVCP